MNRADRRNSLKPILHPFHTPSLQSLCAGFLMRVVKKMGMHNTSNFRPEPDQIMVDIAEYTLSHEIGSPEAYDTARYCLMDTIGCGLLALQYPECTKLLGPTVPGAILANGARVPGTDLQLEPVQAAFNIGTTIRWLDFNDTWLAAEWGHPSDNLGGILAVGDYLSRNNIKSLTVQDLLTAMIKAYEIQGILAVGNSFNRVGLDHVILVRVATAAVVTAMLGGTKEQVINAISHAWADGGALRTYRHMPNTGSRKSWAAGDATSRGVQLALIAMTDEMGYPSILSAKDWGFCDVLFKGRELVIERPLDSYVMENILFKLSFPAEFHAQTAVECAIHLHPQVKGRLNEISKVAITTHESAMRIINKTGPLHNPADRDHCLQYMTAIGLIFGELSANHYQDDVAKDQRIDELRQKMLVNENPQFTKDYLDPEKRSITNEVEIEFYDETRTSTVRVDYPIGHRRRRKEGVPVLIEKFRSNLATRFPSDQCEKIMALCMDVDVLRKTHIHELADLFVGFPV